MKRVAGVDYGRRRVGLAISDPLGLTVRGLDTVFVPADDAAGRVQAVAARLASEDVGRLVVGLPLYASGDESEMSREARAFGRSLGEALGVPVVFVDESLTSWEAEEVLRARGRTLRDARRRGEVDREAACALLRGWLREPEGTA